MTLLIVSFIAGVLTVLAPCILPLLPVIIGGTVIRADGSRQKRWYRPLVIVSSLAVSVVAFTLLLKATTVLLGVPQAAWQWVAGGIILLFGITLIFPNLWAKLMVATGLESRTNKLLGSSRRFEGVGGDIVLGAALGPVFASCSPTYALIVAAVLPSSFAQGLIYLIAYAVGLAGSLLIIALAGQNLTARLGWLSNPNGWFRKFIGILFIIVAIGVILGTDKQIQAYILERGWYDPIKNFELRLESGR